MVSAALSSGRVSRTVHLDVLSTTKVRVYQVEVVDLSPSGSVLLPSAADPARARQLDRRADLVVSWPRSRTASSTTAHGIRCCVS